MSCLQKWSQLKCGRGTWREHNMATIPKRGNSYLPVVSMGYDCKGNRIKPKQKPFIPRRSGIRTPLNIPPFSYKAS